MNRCSHSSPPHIPRMSEELLQAYYLDYLILIAKHEGGFIMNWVVISWFSAGPIVIPEVTIHMRVGMGTF